MQINIIQMICTKVITGTLSTISQIGVNNDIKRPAENFMLSQVRFHIPPPVCKLELHKYHHTHKLL